MKKFILLEEFANKPKNESIDKRDNRSKNQCCEDLDFLFHRKF